MINPCPSKEQTMNITTTSLSSLLKALKKPLTVALIAAATAATSLGHAQQAPRKLTMSIGHAFFFPSTEAYAYAVPLQLGYFAQEGLDVKIEPTSSDSTSIQLVTAGEADIGMAGPSTAFNAIGRGARIIPAFNLTPRYGTGLAVLANSPIQVPADMKGKTLGVADVASGRAIEAKVMLKSAGLEVDKDTSIVAVGYGAQAAAALTSNRVSGLYMWDNAYFLLQARGIELRVIRDVFPEAKQMLDYVMFFNSDLVRKEPEVVAKYGRAVARGMAYMSANPDAALELFYKTFPQNAPKTSQDREVDLKTIRGVAGAINIKGSALPKWGYFPESFVDTTVKFYKDRGEIPASVDAKKVFTNQFVDAYNKF
jgi:NitT/TauT family transport system substrate-binding protein